MRKADSARKRPAVGIRWDEQNLQDNEVIKATINKTKINEPKTPYHGPLGDQHMEDVDDGMQPLELDSHPQQHPAPSLGVSSAVDDDPCTGTTREAVANEDVAPDTPEAAQSGAASEAANGCSASVTAGSSGSSDHKHVHGHGHHAHFQPSLVLEDVAGEPENPSGFSSESERRISLTDGSDGELNGDESRRKFEQRRRAHYNMRAALRRARMLMSEDEDERNSDSEDGLGRMATCSTDAAPDADVTMSDGGKQAGGDTAAS
ncbi:hypothetical protein VaNZ11_002198 [Volvox africanus]|uniref:Protein phosphatase inhibitor 2 n=1 Tax=Volvox africanus TaxID=51714 RepID=A0ABQ5RRD9_9CHLO|nr:hypothetical protein VaNZ11_002198 [Volvox africanus]